MNDARFQALIEALEAMPEADFDMERWDGCAVSHYIRHNAHCGLTVQWMRVDFGDGEKRMALMLFDPLTKAIGYTAAAGHFGLRLDEAFRLLSPTEYPSPNKCVVIGRLVAFYEGHRRKTFGEKIMGAGR
ncbi:MAG TPA: hypothetical protein VK797_23555 [Tepidisphaeraceae bacterium]|jgi:hypothetical protein|nr:hypothetical protein [Tepidisphaeraceae bacterium]